MRKKHALALLLAAGAAALFPNFSRGAQLKAGAKTSSAVTATDPKQKAIQVAFDPSNFSFSGSGGSGGSGGGTVDFSQQAVQSFQLDVQYDSSVVHIIPDPTSGQSITFVAPFDGSDSNSGSGGFSDEAQTFGVVPNTLTLDTVFGSAFPTNTVPGDVFLFNLWFALNNGVDPNTQIVITFGAFAPGAFLTSFDPNNPQVGVTVDDPNLVTPSQVVGTFASFSAGVSAAPLPAAAPVGAAALIAGGVAGALIKRRRQIA